MAIPEPELIAAIESSLHLSGAVPGIATELGIPGVRGLVTGVSHPLANLVGMARLMDGEADGAVARVHEAYAAWGKAFGWIVGPGSRPADLERRLAAAGLSHVEALAGMALTDMSAAVPPDPAIRIREIAPAEALAQAEMMGRAYDLPEDVVRTFVSLLAGNAQRFRSRGYFAYLAERPVAWSYLVYVPLTRIALLGGAATLAEARGHGIYTALVRRRLQDARADGIEAAVIQAVRSTSAPICAKLGFRELCALEVWAWSPR